MMLSETCIRRPVLTTLVTASIIVLGVFAYRLLSVAALPAVDFPTINITAQLPGASAETMAASVAAPIERQNLGADSIQQVAIVGDQYERAGKFFQALLQHVEGVDIQIVGRLI